MNIYKISFLMAGTALLAVSCKDIDEQLPEGNYLHGDQVIETNTAVPERRQAAFAGIFNIMAKPDAAYPGSGRDDDFGFVMAALSLDLEGADVFGGDNDYNWFSTASEWSNRNPNYANPFIRYKIPYSQIGLCNEFIASLPEGSTDSTVINQLAQCRVVRCFDYMALAPYFQFGYATSADKPCVPLLKDGVDFTNNPRATVSEVYNYVITELTEAIAQLEQAKVERTSKAYVNINVAYGLRARANLAIGKYAEAADDAAKAAEGFTPASMKEVGQPAFCSLEESNWIWGINVTTEMVQSSGYPTASSWISAFSGDGYAAATGNVPHINTLLYDKISDTDVRKGWWLDENLHSPNWASLTWVDPKDNTSKATGDAIATFETSDGGKIKFDAYSSIKFGMKSGIGSTVNNNDWPLMRVEEMILIQAEGLAKSGQEGQARQILENFVKTYRDPSYNTNIHGLALADEIWLQRRIELWCEGFFMSDAKRLGKPIVRFHGTGQTPASNVPESWQFNIAADNAYMNMRFPTTEMNNNAGIVDNSGGTQPLQGENPTLRDGVTD